MQPACEAASRAAMDERPDRVRTSLLIIGAGPFGLAMAAIAGARGIDYVMAGQPMEFWRRNMPRGMTLRSACDWHLDPTDEHTIDAFLAERRQTAAEVEPLSLDFYLAYADWFCAQKHLDPQPARVTALDRDAGGDLIATFDDASSIAAASVVLAPGFRHFAHVPVELAALLPEERYSHTCDEVDLGRLTGCRCLIVGGRQSAFESAALLREHGAVAVHVSYRHDTPDFTASDWSWVNQMVARMARQPHWYRELSDDERADLNQRFWREGRLKLEPWLAPRLAHPEIELLPQSNMVSSRLIDDTLEITFADGRIRAVDHVLFATGYKVDMARVPYLSPRLRSEMALDQGFPVLDTSLQTTAPGLYVTSLPATRSFGLFFGFTTAVRASAQIIAADLQRRAAPPGSH